MTRTAFSVILLGLLLTNPLAAQDAQAPPPTTVDASRGGVTIASGPNSLTIGARAQARWTVDDREQYDADTTGTGVGREDGTFSQFDFTRLRVTLSGGAYRPWLRYAFQVEFSRTSGDGDSKIKDAILEIRPGGRSYRFQFGQFKVPFGLQLLTSSGRLQFVDRAITDAKFNPARDTGVMVSGTVADRLIGYDVGVFNGSGESVRQNNRSHLWAARAYFDPFGPYALSEGGSDAVRAPVLHVGAGARGGKAVRGRTPSGVIEEADNQNAYNVELAFKAPRFFATAEHFWMTDEYENPVPGPELQSRGYHAQAGYMLMPRTTEIGLLYARVRGDSDVDDAEVSELRGVASYYWQSHSLKLQADIGQVSYGSAFATLAPRARLGLPGLGTRLVTGEDLADTQLRVQLTLAF